jgi:hypothetical protein
MCPQARDFIHFVSPKNTLKKPQTTTKGQAAIQRHYCLRFGLRGTETESIEVRNNYFELVGRCATHDHQNLAVLFGKTLDQRHLDRIASISHGQITPIEL